MSRLTRPFLIEWPVSLPVPGRLVLSWCDACGTFGFVAPLLHGSIA